MPIEPGPAVEPVAPLAGRACGDPWGPGLFRGAGDRVQRGDGDRAGGAESVQPPVLQDVGVLGERLLGFGRTHDKTMWARIKR